MERGKLSFTAVYLKSDGEYIGFIEELPALNSRGRTLNDAREALQNLAAEVFDEERRRTAQAHAGRGMVRESFFIPALDRNSGSEPDLVLTYVKTRSGSDPEFPIPAS